MTEKRIVGWIGLGKMGIPMSRNVRKAGFPLISYDIVPDRIKELDDPGARSADSLKELAEQSEVIISMIPDDRSLRDVALGADAIIRTAKPGTIFIDMSTVSPVASKQVAEAAQTNDIQYLRAPVSGSTSFAESALLTILCSGPREAYDASLDLFEVMGKKVFYVGEAEEARYLKLLLNMMVAITSAMTAEALTFGELGGIEWEQMIDVINNSAVAAPQIGFKVQMLKDRDFTPAFTVTQMAKDLDIALNTGKEVNAPMQITSMVRQFLGVMMAQGRGDIDFFSLVTLMEKMAGLADHGDR